MQWNLFKRKNKINFEPCPNFISSNYRRFSLRKSGKPARDLNLKQGSWVRIPAGSLLINGASNAYNLAGEGVTKHEYQHAAIFCIISFVPAGEAAGVTKVADDALENAAKGVEEVIEQATVHGNSLKSMKPTWGYKLYSNDGTLAKLT
ncbi:MAG: hypothetical protein JNL24_00700 [Bacteroidia bacterium]|nr:hypothetical protein [Bacteroidia bacterium]